MRRIAYAVVMAVLGVLLLAGVVLAEGYVIGLVVDGRVIEVVVRVDGGEVVTVTALSEGVEVGYVESAGYFVEVVRDANLRTGPGVGYAVVRVAAAGERLLVVEENAAGDWVREANGGWIAAFLVREVLVPAASPTATPGRVVPVVTVVPTIIPPTVVPPTVPAPTWTPVPPTATVARAQCDPSYPGVCIPPYPPDLNCGDIEFRRFQVLPPDPHGFDRDKDGIGCES